MKNAIINLIIILSLFSLAKTTTNLMLIDYNFQTNSTSCQGTETMSYLVNFGSSNNIPIYMKVEVISKDEKPAPLLCFSNQDQNCLSRQQLVKNPNGKNAFLWLKREEFSFNTGDELFILVQCEKDSCLYDLTLKGQNNLIFEPNFVYSYLISSYNKEMRFQIQVSDKNSYMTISLEGSSKATLNVENINNYGNRHRTGHALTFSLNDIDNEDNIVAITVRASDVGDYLTLSAHLVNVRGSYEGFAPDQYLLPNGPEISGYLEKEFIDKECFPFDLTDPKYDSISQLYLTGIIHTKYALFYLENENKVILEGTYKKILDGQLSFVINNNKKMNYICFELIDEATNTQYQTAFTFSVTEPSSLSNLYNYYPPQVTGEIFRRIIPKGSIAFFSGVQSDSTAKRYYNLYQIKGLTKMYIADCDSYPNCHYNKTELDKLL